MRQVTTVPANLFKGLLPMGGELTLGADGLVFSAHALNIQKETIFIPYASIERISFPYLPNIIKLVSQQSSYYLTVYQRRKLAQLILAQKDDYLKNHKGNKI